MGNFDVCVKSIFCCGCGYVLKPGHLCPENAPPLNTCPSGQSKKVSKLLFYKQNFNFGVFTQASGFNFVFFTQALIFKIFQLAHLVN